MILKFIWRNDHVEIANRGERQRQRQREREGERGGGKRHRERNSNNSYRSSVGLWEEV